MALIDQQEAIKKIRSNREYVADTEWIKGLNAGIEYSVEEVENLPTVQPKRGKWIEDGKCDQCSGSAPFWPLANTYYCSNFCPHCGADMRGGVDG